MSHFQLTLQNKDSTRVASYDPYLSKLYWADTKEDIILKELNENAQMAIFPISPQNPGKKVKSLKKIKIQMGFACNYSCTYCSQNNQRAFSTDSARQTLEKVPAFFNNMEKWFDGGEDGLGGNVHLEFWGGETLLYWTAVEHLASLLRQKYPNISLALFTNGSMVKKEMVDFAKRIRLHFIVSHDGPTFNEDRAKDPFDIPAQAEGLHYLFSQLNPEGLISFNATVSPKNYSISKIRDYIANKLVTDPKGVIVTCDLATPYDSEGLAYVSKPERRKELVNNLFDEFKSLFPFQLKLGMTDQIIHDFYESLKNGRNAETVGQKCSMECINMPKCDSHRWPLNWPCQ
jgi:uncharacterized protein